MSQDAQASSVDEKAVREAPAEDSAPVVAEQPAAAPVDTASAPAAVLSSGSSASGTSAFGTFGGSRASAAGDDDGGEGGDGHGDEEEEDVKGGKQIELVHTPTGEENEEEVFSMYASPRLASPRLAYTVEMKGHLSAPMLDRDSPSFRT